MFFSESTSEILTFFASLGIILGLYAQAWRVWTRKSADDLSFVLVFSIALNELMWFNYGAHLWPDQKVILAVPALNIPAVIWLAAGYTKYRNGSEVDGKAY